MESKNFVICGDQSLALKLDVQSTQGRIETKIWIFQVRTALLKNLKSSLFFFSVYSITT